MSKIVMPTWVHGVVGITLTVLEFKLVHKKAC